MNQKSQQLSFLPPTDIPQNLKTLAKQNPSLCYQKLRQKELTVGFSLWFIIEENLNLDFAVLWEEFERHGQMTYLDISINDVKFEVVEDNGMEVYFNENLIFAWDENDVFDSETAGKIKAAIKGFVYNNQYQFGVEKQ